MDTDVGFCSGESGSEDSSEGIDANCENVGVLASTYALFIW